VVVGERSALLDLIIDDLMRSTYGI
jgi:hypothetical protein